MPFAELQPTHRDRVLILAPHPDDESLGCATLISRTLEAGGTVRVLLATNGDNNPWPQRFVERRWQVGPEERKRWGERRKQEATAALHVLGLPDDAVHFMEFPDQGFTGALLRSDARVLDAFIGAIRDWRPTLLVVPSPNDIHPDHNAIALLFELALRRLPESLRPRVIHFPIHPHDRYTTDADLVLHLTPEEIARKRRAILCHGTQMALSQKRFLGYAKPEESYLSAAWDRARDRHHPVREAAFENGALRLVLNVGWRFDAPRVLLVAENVLDENACWEVRLRQQAGALRITECITGRPLKKATLRRTDEGVELRIPMAPLQPVDHLFVKVDRRLAFYDRAGWVRVPVGVPTAMPAVESGEPGLPSRAPW